MNQRLRAIDVAPASIQSVIVTHEHFDHARGVAACARLWNWSVIATGGTRMMCSDWTGLPIQIVERKSRFALGDFDVQTLPVCHDATEPIGLIVTDRQTGARAGIVYDLGCVTETVSSAIQHLEVLILESNHDEHMLRAGPYPPSVQARISGRNGHLCNRDAARAAADSVHAGLRHIVLAHLSEKCNDPKVALKATGDALRHTRFKGRLTASAQNLIAGPFTPGGEGPVARTAQLALGI